MEVLDGIKKYQWYCLEHNGGWPLKAHRGALQHLSKHPLWELANLEVTNADTIGTEPENSSTQEVVSSYLNEQFRSNK